jgi:lysophospholipase L1-like esterase
VTPASKAATSRLRKTILGLLTAGAVLVCLEIVLGATRGFWEANHEGRDEKAIRSDRDPEAFSVDFGTDSDEALGETLRFNIRSNELTRPDPELLFRVRPNASGNPIHGYSGINAQGFRGRPLEPTKASVNRSVLILGDSCGFGWGVRDYQHSLGETLERKLKKEDPSYRVYNLSQPGYSTAQARRLYEAWAPKIKPDAVVFYLGWNDLWPAGRWNDAQALKRVQWLNQPILRELQQSNLYDFLATFLSQTERETDRPDRDRAYRPRVELADSLENFRSMINDAQERGSRVLLIPPPSLKGAARAAGSLRIGAYNEALRGAFSERVDVVELEEMRKGKVDSARFFLRDGYHPSPTGAAYVADEIAQRLTRTKPNP